MTMIYSPNPPTGRFKDDEARWNWRWLFKGEDVNEAYDLALQKHFGAAQANIVSGTPADALASLIELCRDEITDDIKARAIEAQSRLFPPLIAGREDNVVTVNFGRRT